MHASFARYRKNTSTEDQYDRQDLSVMCYCIMTSKFCQMDFGLWQLRLVESGLDILIIPRQKNWHLRLNQRQKGHMTLWNTAEFFGKNLRQWDVNSKFIYGSKSTSTGLAESNSQPNKIILILRHCGTCLESQSKIDVTAHPHRWKLDMC